MIRCVFIAVLLVTQTAHAEQVENVLGKAYSADRQELLYEERHQMRGQHHEVNYLLPDGTHIAVNTLDYSHDDHAPDFRQSDLQSGTVRGAQWQGDRYEVFSNDRSKLIKASRQLVASSGFNRFLTQRLDQLLSGETLAFDFAVPERLDSVSLKATYQGLTETGLSHIQIKAANRFVGLFAPEINLFYDADKRLREYRGPSNIVINNDAPSVSIRYFYGDLPQAEQASAAPSETS